MSSLDRAQANAAVQGFKSGKENLQVPESVEPQGEGLTAASADQETEEGRETRERDQATKRQIGASADSLQIFVTQIRLREKNGMDTFMDAETREKLEQGVEALRAVATQQEPVNLERVRASFQDITVAFSKFERQPQKGPVREDTRNLGVVGESLKKLYTNIDGVKSSLGDSSEDTAAATDLLTRIDGTHRFIEKLKKAAENYLRG